MHKSITYIKEYVSLNCKQATLMASKSLDNKLTSHEKLALKWHMLICQNCALYFKQIKQIRNSVRQHQESISRLSDEARQRITQAVLEVERSIQRDI